MKKKKTARQSKLKINKKLNKKKKDSKKELVIYVFNVVEDEWPFISSFKSKVKRNEIVNSLNKSADCYLFVNSAYKNFLYISPVKIDPEFKKYFQKITGNNNAEIIVPLKKTGLVSEDFYYDKEQFKKFINNAKKYQRIKLLSYCASPEFIKLKEKINQSGIDIYAPESPEPENFWTVNFFGSKGGARQTIQQFHSSQSDFMMPNGVITYGRENAAKIAASRYIKEKGIVLKTNKGNGGEGVLIFRDGGLPKNYNLCEKKISDLLEKETYWDKFPIIIEQYVNLNIQKETVFPSVEYLIHDNGKPEMLYYCIMKVSKEGKYYGMDMSKTVLSKKYADKIVDAGYRVANKYSEAGYRGFFDIDMISAISGLTYITETNMRNTCGTDIYKLTKKIYGDNFFSKIYVISRENLKLKVKKPISFEHLLKKTEPVLFDKRNKEGVIFSSSAYLSENYLLYSVFGKNKRRAYNIESKLIKIFDSLEKSSK